MITHWPWSRRSDFEKQENFQFHFSYEGKFVSLYMIETIRQTGVFARQNLHKPTKLQTLVAW
jgi:hypothetical protein